MNIKLETTGCPSCFRINSSLCISKVCTVFIAILETNIFLQVQGQLRVTNMKKCYFVCYISPEQPIKVIEIERDEDFIAGMVPKLVAFLKKCVLPEIILRRVKKNAKCLDL